MGFQVFRPPGANFAEFYARGGGGLFEIAPGDSGFPWGAPRRGRKKPGIRGGVFREHRGRRPGRKVPGRKATEATRKPEDGAKTTPGRRATGETGAKRRKPGRKPSVLPGSRGGKAGGWGGFAGESRAESHTGAEKTPGSRDCAGRKTGFSGADGGKKGGHRGRKPGVWGKNGDSGGRKAFSV